MAHIPDGFLSPPVLAGAAAASAAALAVAARRSRVSLAERRAPLLGAATAFVFAAQMLNFPLGAGTSAHLLGGTLLAVVLGPWAAMTALFSVVIVQALLFQDGGIAALGANALNLAVIGAGGGWLAYRWLLSLLGAGRRGRLWAAGGAGFLSAVLTGLAVAGQLALSGVVGWGTAALAIGGAHVAVGAAEGALTAAIVGALLRARPDLLAGRDVPTPAGRRWSLGVTGAALGVAVLAGYRASSAPDVLESAAARFGLGEGTALFEAPLAGYAAPVGGAWAAAAVGVAAAFGLAWLVVRVRARRGPAA